MHHFGLLRPKYSRDAFANCYGNQKRLCWRRPQEKILGPFSAFVLYSCWDNLLHPAFGPGVRVFGLQNLDIWTSEYRKIERGGDRWASPIWVLHSRHTPLVQDDGLRRGVFLRRAALFGIGIGWPKGDPSVTHPLNPAEQKVSGMCPV